MPVTFTIDSSRRRAVIVIVDPYTIDDGQCAMKAVLAHPQFGPDFDFLVDRRLATAPTTAYVRHAIDFMLAHAPRIGQVRAAAVVADTPVALGMSHLAAAMAEIKGAGLALKTFASMEDAERWLAMGVPATT